MADDGVERSVRIVQVHNSSSKQNIESWGMSWKLSLSRRVPRLVITPQTSKTDSQMITHRTLAAGAFICVAGMYVSVKQIVDAYASGQVTAPFSC